MTGGKIDAAVRVLQLNVERFPRSANAYDSLADAYRKKGNRQCFPSHVEQQNFFLVQAFVARESEDAVPVDQIIVYTNQKIPAIVLPAGGLRIRAMDKTGKILTRYEKKTG